MTLFYKVECSLYTTHTCSSHSAEGPIASADRLQVHPQPCCNAFAPPALRAPAHADKMLTCNRRSSACVAVAARCRARRLHERVPIILPDVQVDIPTQQTEDALPLRHAGLTSRSSNAPAGWLSDPSTTSSSSRPSLRAPRPAPLRRSLDPRPSSHAPGTSRRACSPWLPAGRPRTN